MIRRYRRRFLARQAAFLREVAAGKARPHHDLPSDQRDDHADVAFGVTTGGVYLDARMIEATDGRPFRRGLISHSALLVAAGFARDLEDPEPTEDFVVRGIVKPRLHGRVIFWETAEEMLTRPGPVGFAVKNLLERGLVAEHTSVHPAGEAVPMATVAEMCKDWTRQGKRRRGR